MACYRCKPKAQRMQHPMAVITGIGAVTPLGLDIRSSWDALCAGRSGIAPVSGFDAAGLRTRVAGQIPGFDPLACTDARTAHRYDRFILLALAAAHMALADAGLEIGPRNAERIGVAAGNSLAGAATIEAAAQRVAAEGNAARLSPFTIPGSIGSMSAGLVAMATGARGPNLGLNAGCASSAAALGQALDWLRLGRADAVLAGGSEAALCRHVFCAYASLKATTARNDDPSGASRPFDAGRDGFVPAEAGVFLVVERLETARARGARILCELAGYGTACDAYHPTRPDPEGRACIRCMESALADAGLGPADVDMVSAHGTSTPANDVTEAMAIRAVLGERARRVPVTANKSMTGHTIGAAGALQAAFAVLSLRSGVVPPTINLDHPDPECALDLDTTARARSMRVALSNSFAFGGVNSSLVLRLPREAS